MGLTTQQLIYGVTRWVKRGQGLAMGRSLILIITLPSISASNLVLAQTWSTVNATSSKTVPVPHSAKAINVANLEQVATEIDPAASGMNIPRHNELANNEVSAPASVDAAINVQTSIINASKSVYIGDQITVKISVQHPAAMAVTLVGNVTPLAPFELIAAPVTIPASNVDAAVGSRRTEFLLVLAPFKTGELVLPVWEVNLNGNLRRSSAALPLVVTALTTDTDTTIKPVELMPAPPTGAWLQSRNVVVLLGTLLIYIMGQAVIGIYRQRTATVAVTPPTVALLAAERSLEADTIAQLQATLQQAKNTGNLEPFYTALAEIINNYLMLRYQIVFKSLTTIEITRLLVDRQAAGSLIQIYQQLLTLCDWAKYAAVMLPLTKAEPLVNQMIIVLQELTTAETKVAAAAVAAVPTKVAASNNKAANSADPHLDPATLPPNNRTAVANSSNTEGRK
jgi:hypothetical protein